MAFWKFFDVFPVIIGGLYIIVGIGGIINNNNYYLFV